jgi:hypothetical protein
MKIIKEKVNLTNLTKFLNEDKRFQKKTETPFTNDNVFQYIQAGNLPWYMGQYIIEKCEDIEGVKLYNLKEK